MFGQHGNQRLHQDYDQFPSLHTAADPFSQMLPTSAIMGHDHDSAFGVNGELGHSSSGCSSYVDSPTSNSTTYGAQSPTFILSSHSLISSDAYYIEPENSHDSTKDQLQQYSCDNKWSNGRQASESIFESMNRATPYSAEEKKERIERYRSKRNLRNFNKKIKYECRKTLADSRPRVRGRFARNDEIEMEMEIASQPQWDCAFADEGDYCSWINILDSLNKSDALLSSFL